MFAQALDRDDFHAARPMLRADCTYTIRDKVLRGPDAILASYQSATDDAHAKFDAIDYSSDISIQSSHIALIEFSDVLTHQGQTHHHKCHQRLTIDDAGLIVAIKHIDLPGERETLLDFLRRVGLE